jgi:hypothetical protein
VISENPVAGTQVNTGSSVSLVISSGVAQVTVPNVVGQTQAAATSAIQSAGLVVGTITSTASSTVASGSVISENPAAGAQVNPGSAVALVISAGPIQINTVSVSPSSGTGISQTFVAVYSDTGGASTFNRRLLLISPGLNGTAHECYVQADLTGIYLVNDSGNQLIGPVSSKINIANSQCTLTGSGTSLVNSGNTSTLTVALTFKPAYYGAMNTYMLATDTAGSATGWQMLGTYTAGPAQVAVPNVVGQTQAAATSAIQAAGLVVGTVTTAPSSTAPLGSVISESPTAGTQVNAGSAVNLVVSSGG